MKEQGYINTRRAGEVHWSKQRYFVSYIDPFAQMQVDLQRVEEVQRKKIQRILFKIPRRISKVKMNKKFISSN